MKVSGFHLTYCSNIHPGESWHDVRQALASNLPAVRRHLQYEGPLGIGLRLSAAAAETLEPPAELDAFRAFLREGDYYVFTINGFPYGAFHGQRVKEEVYLPDWRDERRLDYSNRLARILAALLPAEDGLDGSVSTVPCALKAHLTGRTDLQRIVDLLLRHVAELVDIRERTGRTIVLAIEPEPACFIETTEEAVNFFRSWLFNPVVLRRAASSLPRTIDRGDVKRHLGLCYDACHMAVQYEDPQKSIADIIAADIRIAKIQLSSALRVRFRGHDSKVESTLRSFAEATYLHQVVEHNDLGVRRYLDLPEALDASSPDDLRREWRIHFHLPIYIDRAPGFDTTSEQLASLLDLARRQRFCLYLEVETYTWSVLAPEYRTLDLPSAIARELAWVRDRLS